MTIPEDSAYSALKDTDHMQNFKVSACPYSLRNNKSLIICKEDGCLCYDKKDCPYKEEYKARIDFQEMRNNARGYECMLKVTPEEQAHQGLTWGQIIDTNPKFAVKQLIRRGTYKDLRKNLEFLSLEIVNAYYSHYLTHGREYTKKYLGTEVEVF